jgi:hypothetical protein
MVRIITCIERDFTTASIDRQEFLMLNRKTHGRRRARAEKVAMVDVELPA